MTKSIHSEEAERGVLGSIMCPGEADKILSLCSDYSVTEQSFYVPSHRYLFQIIWNMKTKGKPIDLLTVGEEAKASGSLDAIGGYQFIETLIDSTPTAAHAEYYLGFVQNKEQLRDTVDVAQKAIDSAYKPDADSLEVMSMLQANALSLAQNDPSDLCFNDVGMDFIEKCEAGVAGTVPHFLDAWTSLLGKLSNELMILHAPRSTGKTAWIVQWHRAAAKAGIKPAFLSLESPKATIYQRYLAQEGQINTLDMRRKDLPASSPTFQKARQAHARIKDMKLEIKDGTYTIQRIRSYATMQKKLGAKILFIDNLLCISDDGSFDSRTAMYMHFLQELREIRNELQIPIVALAHPRDDGRLAWSTDAENLVDILIYMYDVENLRNKDPEKFEKSGMYIRPTAEGERHVCCKVQKNRDGETPQLHLAFWPEFQTFRAM